MTPETAPFDPAEYLTEPEDQLDLILEAYHSGDQTYLRHALETVDRARSLDRARAKIEPDGANIAGIAV